MNRSVCFLILFLAASSPLSAQSIQRRPARETWYERVLRQINPSDTDWGAIWEQHKQEFLDQIGNPYFRYGLGSTATIVWLLIVLFAQHVSHRRAQQLAVQSMADMRRHDEYARQAAREAIRRYNEHIESCNRVIEAAESGASRWMSSSEVEALESETQQARSEATALREETKRLREEIQKQSAVIAGMSVRSGDAQPSLPFAKDAPVSQYVARINELQQELLEERKKNQRRKSTPV
jgi:hypothetical protein